MATNSIRGGANREVLKPVVDGGRIFNAWSDEEWTVDGAAVRVSLICFSGTTEAEVLLNGEPVVEVFSDLTAHAGGSDLTDAKALSENSGKSIIGRQKDGPLDVQGDVGRMLANAPGNPHGKPNWEIVRPWRNGMDLTRRPSDRWLIDFMALEEQEAALFQAPFEYERWLGKTEHGG